MAIARREPYIWPTWLTKILAGEASCEWAAWFKAHYEKYEKAPRSGDLIGWTARHGEMVRKRAEELRSHGYEVTVEDQNKFTLKGHSCTLQGKPDIVAVKDDDFLVSDIKSGKQRDSDHFQVLIYMMVLPLTHPKCLGQKVRGELEYVEERIDIDVLPNRQREMVMDLIGRIAGEAPAVLVPSFRECRFCDLTKTDCKDRVQHDTPTTKTALF